MKKLALLFVLTGSVLLSNSFEEVSVENESYEKNVLEEVAAKKTTTETTTETDNDTSVRSIWLIGDEERI